MSEDASITFRRRAGCALELGEGPRWAGSRLVLVDILRGVLYEHDETLRSGLAPLLSTGQLPLGAVAPVSGRDEWIAAVGTGVALLAPDVEPIWITRNLARHPGMRVNDGSADPWGRFWSTMMPLTGEPGRGTVHLTDRSGGTTTAFDGLDIPNGPVFTAAGDRGWIADSARRLILTFSLSGPHHRPGRLETFAAMDDGSPDGMTIDNLGHLWVAVWGAGVVRRLSPSGRLLEERQLPARQPTAPCLGGADGRTLFVTSATHGLDRPNHGDGDLWASRVEVPGPPAWLYEAEFRL